MTQIKIYHIVGRASRFPVDISPCAIILRLRGIAYCLPAGGQYAIPLKRRICCQPSCHAVSKLAIGSESVTNKISLHRWIQIMVTGQQFPHAT
jgi:hypothetical protein